MKDIEIGLMIGPLLRGLVAALCLSGIPGMTLAADPGEPLQGLRGALQAMIANHPAIIGKRAELQAAGFDTETLKARRYPTLSLQSGYYEDGTTQAKLRVQQPLWAFGGIDNPIARAEAQQTRERVDLLRVVRQLMEETVLSYVQIEQLRQSELVATENVQEHQRLYDQIERRQRGQLASRADVLLASSRLIQARGQLQQIQGELQVAVTQLHNLTRTAVDSSMPVDRVLVQLAERSGIEQRAIRHSAEVRLKFAALTVAEKSISEERSASMPTLYFSMEQQLLDVPTGTDDTVLMLGFEGSFDGLGKSSQGRVSSVTMRAAAARQDLISTRNDVEQQTRSLLSRRDLQSTLLESHEASTEALSDTMSSYERQYAAGRKAWLEVLNIQRELAQQKQQRVQVEGEWLRTSLQLMIMMGALDNVVGIGTGE
jgi:adhesin transport system outer membrane protein